MLTARRPPAAALLALALLTRPSRGAAEEPAAPARPRLEAQNGIVRAADLAAHSLTVEGEAGAFTVSLDRNTLVYLPGGLATVAALKVGARVRVGRDGARASWVEVREEPGEAPPPERPPPAPAPPARSSP